MTELVWFNGEIIQPYPNEEKFDFDDKIIIKIWVDLTRLAQRLDDVRCDLGGAFCCLLSCGLSTCSKKQRNFYCSDVVRLVPYSFQFYLQSLNGIGSKFR